VGVPILFTDKSFVLDFTSIATLFAFVLVCGGVLLIPKKEKVAGRFTIPYVNGQFFYPLIVVGAMAIITIYAKDYFPDAFNFDFSGNDDYVSGKASFMDVATPKISIITFWAINLILSIVTVFKKFSLIPLMGVTTCLYLLTGMTKSNWAWFFGWMALGLVIYFLYGYRKSHLAKAGVVGN
jgi:basic amino acid/polyamine antiporter, APA family